MNNEQNNLLKAAAAEGRAHGMDGQSLVDVAAVLMTVALDPNSNINENKDFARGYMAAATSVGMYGLGILGKDLSDLL